MRIYKHPASLEIWSPAKLNLSLEVLGKRPDGFHEIESLMVPISWYDTLYVSVEPSGKLELKTEWAAGFQPPEDDRSGKLPPESMNLVYRALDRLRTAAGVKQGMRVRLVKRIPLAAGLAGGSSNAAAALVAGSRLWGLNWKREQLSQIAMELGSDLPFFFTGGAAIARGRGEQLNPVAGLAGISFVVAKPPAGLSTAEVYRACQPASVPTAADDLVKLLKTGDLAAAGKRFVNRLQPAAERLSPWILRLKRVFQTAHLPGHLMSGSGTSYFGLCHSARQGRRICDWIRSQLPGQVFLVQTVF